MADTAVSDRIVASAQSLHSLVATAKVESPLLANAILGDATKITTTQIGAAVAGIITWISVHYGFGWDGDTVSLVTAVAIMLGGTVVHLVQVVLYRRAMAITPNDLAVSNAAAVTAVQNAAAAVVAQNTTPTNPQPPSSQII